MGSTDILIKRVAELEAERDRLREALEKAKRAIWKYGSIEASDIIDTALAPQQPCDHCNQTGFHKMSCEKPHVEGTGYTPKGVS